MVLAGKTVASDGSNKAWPGRSQLFWFFESAAIGGIIGW
jgi:hypothetical protein